MIEEEPVWTSSEVVRFLCDALDCVSDNADVCQSDAYMWVKSVLPRDLWFAVWGSLGTPRSLAACSDRSRRPSQIPPWECTVESNVRSHFDFGASRREDENTKHACKSLVHADLAMLAATRTLVGAANVEKHVAGSSAHATPKHTSVHLQGYRGDCELAGYSHVASLTGGHTSGFSQDATLRLPLPEDALGAGGSPPNNRGTLADFFQSQNRRGSTQHDQVPLGDGSVPFSQQTTPRQPAAAARSASARRRQSLAPEAFSAEDRGMHDDRAASPQSPSHATSRSDRDELDSRLSPTNQVVNNWLDDGRDSSSLTPMQVADWLRTLPSIKVDREAKKTLARRVLHYSVDGDDFLEILTSGRWAELDLRDEREAVTLLRLFKQRQQESALAHAARDNFRAMRSSSMRHRGERLVA